MGTLQPAPVMGILRDIESRIERVVEGTFGRVFRADVQPVELARKLAKELEDGKVVSVSRTYAPNEYTVYLHPKDRERFSEYEASLRTELAGYLAEHARRAGYSLVTRPKVTFETEPSLAQGTFGIATRLVAADDVALDDPAAAEQEPIAADDESARETAPVATRPQVEPPLPTGGVVPGPPPPAPVPDLPLVAPAAAAVPIPVPIPVPLPGVDAAPPVPLVSDLPQEEPEPLLDEPAPALEPEPEPVAVADPPPPVAAAPAALGADTMLVPPAEASADSPVLVVGGRRVPLDRPVTLIGRSASCDVVVDDANASRRHAELRVRDSGAVLVDLDSTNGSLVNGTRVREQPLADGDTIRIGTTDMVFERG